MIDERLKTVASFVKKGSAVCDVGTDHGYLPCFLVKNNITSNVLATDINIKPLQAASKHIKDDGLEKVVLVRLSDGLQQVTHKEVDTIVIAGMGGDLIYKILTDVSWTKSKDLDFILQPMTHVEVLREKLYSSGFYIKKETPVIDLEHYYTVMSVGYSGINEEISDVFYYAGCIFDYNDAVSIQYCKHIYKRLTRILKGQEKGNVITQNTQKIKKVVQCLEEKLHGND
ncbi:MAG: class I SAM-dependent methyltransferase [Oscillospiraceae bacterium]